MGLSDWVSDWPLCHSLVVESFTIFKRIHEVWMLSHKDNTLFLKCYIAREAFGPVCKGSSLCQTFCTETISLIFLMQWFPGLWTLSTSTISIHSKIQSEITCTHNYPQFSPSWCPSAAGSSSPPPPWSPCYSHVLNTTTWSPPWQSPPCPALSLPSTPSSSQPWCSQQAPNPSEFKITFVRAVCIRLPPTFLLAFCRTSPSQQYDLRHLCAKTSLNFTAPKLFELKTWGRLLFPQGWLALYPERVVFCRRKR